MVKKSFRAFFIADRRRAVTEYSKDDRAAQERTDLIRPRMMGRRE